MIMEWKRSGGGHRASWNGTEFELLEEAGRWRLRADGARVRQNWPTAAAAMHDIDARQQKLIIGLAKSKSAGAANGKAA